jgi:homoserine dehydrogenase
MPQSLRVALAGLGTVGSGVHAVLTRNAEIIQQRSGRSVELVGLADLDLQKAMALSQGQYPVFSDALVMLRELKPDVVVELIGGYGFAREFVLAAIAQGCSVVTANKALLAVHGRDLFDRAQKAGVTIGFEAAVAGGIPIIKALREGLTANRIEWVAGIINGTTNFILSEMRDKALSFEEALSQAQALGYAEADPTFDIEGVDAAHKITLIASLAFGMPVNFQAAHIEGISKLSSQDIAYAEQLGYRIKLVGLTRRRESGVELRVHPTLVPSRQLLANVEGAMNAVLVKGDAVGQTLYYGKGAGSEPTASAVIADLVDLARLNASSGQTTSVPMLSFQPEHLQDLAVLPIADCETGFYIRLRVLDQPGVLADITRVLADGGISIDAFVQRAPQHGVQEAEVVLLTHRCIERNLRLAISRMVQLPSVLNEPITLRVEDLA